MANVEMTIDSIRISLMNYQHVVILKEKETDRYLPIWVGPTEADAIAVKLQDVPIPRPLTHDFLCNIIEITGCKVKSTIISELDNDTFYSKLLIAAHDKSYEVDCRPSDGIAVAVRANAPIFAAEEVLKKAGIVLDRETGKPIEESEVQGYKLEKFSGLTREIFALAQEEAKRLNHSYIGTEHLLLALVHRRPTVATEILTNLGINLAEIVAAIEAGAAEGEQKDVGKRSLDTHAQAAIRLFVEEADRLGSQEVLPEHVLVGISGEEEGIAATVLKSLGVDVDRIHAELNGIQNKP